MRFHFTLTLLLGTFWLYAPQSANVHVDTCRTGPRERLHNAMVQDRN